MAKEKVNTAQLAGEILANVKQGIFAPVYLLMGEEPYYVDMVSKAIIDNALTDDERDFNQLISYGADCNAEDVVNNARRYPMFAERQLVVIKEAQALKSIDTLSVYTDAPMESTVLVLVYRGNLDKRKALYKSIQKNGVILESQPLRDYEMQAWISSYYRSLGLQIAPDAAALLAEDAGTDLGRIAVETAKLLKNLPEGTTSVSAKDIEANVGISREFSIFELNKHLCYKDASKALRAAQFIGASAKFAMPMATAALYGQFNKVLRYEALLMKTPNPAPEDKTKVLGVPAFFFRDYDAAVRNYPLKSCMAAIGLIRDYDYKGKGGDVGAATPQELLVELVTKLLNL